MSARAVSESSPIDTVKLLAAVAIFLVGVFGFYYYEDQGTLYRVLGLVVMSIVAAGIAMSSSAGRQAWGFAKEARLELRKVVWPTKQESLQTTLIVLVMVLIVAIILWLLDMFFLWGVQALVRPGG